MSKIRDNKSKFRVSWSKCRVSKSKFRDSQQKKIRYAWPEYSSVVLCLIPKNVKITRHGLAWLVGWLFWV